VKRSPFAKKKKPPEDMTLQITSMADIFTIILVFLLKGYAAGLTNISPSDGMTLPEAISKAEMKDTVKLEISRDSVVIEQKPIVKLTDFEFNPMELLEDGKNEAIFNRLFAERKNLPVPNMDSNMLVLADERVPYSTLKTVIGSAANAGFVDLQLVVVNIE
jgi:biopolymer transport protein ExbD